MVMKPTLKAAFWLLLTWLVAGSVALGLKSVMMGYFLQSGADGVMVLPVMLLAMQMLVIFVLALLLVRYLRVPSRHEWLMWFPFLWMALYAGFTIFDDGFSLQMLCAQAAATGLPLSPSLQGECVAGRHDAVAMAMVSYKCMLAVICAVTLQLTLLVNVRVLDTVQHAPRLLLGMAMGGLAVSYVLLLDEFSVLAILQSLKVVHFDVLGIGIGKILFVLGYFIPLTMALAGVLMTIYNMGVLFAVLWRDAHHQEKGVA